MISELTLQGKTIQLIMKIILTVCNVLHNFLEKVNFKNKFIIIIYLFFFSQVTTQKKQNKQKKTRNDINKRKYIMLQQCYNTELSPEEGKIRELTGKELAKHRVGIIIKSLVSLSEIISSFFFRKFLLKSLGFYT